MNTNLCHWHLNILKMEKQQEYLLKHFALVLRKLALGKEKELTVDANVAHCLTRKDLIQIVKKQFGGSIPKEHNLVEMEKVELFNLIENEMLIISYMTEKWCVASDSPVTKGISSVTNSDESSRTGSKKPEKKVTPKSNLNGKETSQKK